MFNLQCMFPAHTPVGSILETVFWFWLPALPFPWSRNPSTKNRLPLVMWNSSCESSKCLLCINHLKIRKNGKQWLDKKLPVTDKCKKVPFPLSWLSMILSRSVGPWFFIRRISSSPGFRVPWRTKVQYFLATQPKLKMVFQTFSPCRINKPFYWHGHTSCSTSCPPFH